MKKGLVVLIILLVNTCCAYAQDNSTQNKIRYQTQNYVGILEGQSNTAFQLQTIHGVKYKTWHAGLGAGLDYYYMRSIPLFLDLNKDIIFKDRTFFVSGDIGTNFVWSKSTTTDVIWGGTARETNFSPRLFWAGGLGYRAFFKNQKEAFLINLGYSFKHIREEVEMAMPCQFPPCPVGKETYDSKLNRVSVKVGLQF